MLDFQAIGRSHEQTHTGSSEDITEENLLDGRKILPEDVLRLKKATKRFLCSPDNSKYNIQFLSFCLRDLESNTKLFEVHRPNPFTDDNSLSSCSTDTVETSNRCVRYNFAPNFLRLRMVGAAVEFSVGSNPIKEFKMIERHYFKDKLLKSFDFNFGFVIPDSVNTVEHIYELPKLTNKEVMDMVKNPYETHSDSFYFIDGELIMHNKALYAYNG
ncbi:uncharacterized protein DEA37_0008037 [Paragonimus westermani]|uniref:GMP phosphodiesterase delta subunit domain-containing protein n=1 Tax=Paragonimus westermani TaxID=34504 RepID=A0A5J4NIV5_9TREM|nr:uncharacterized protein DEA37_0008037 [Paragonimus westermani]